MQWSIWLAKWAEASAKLHATSRPDCFEDANGKCGKRHLSNLLILATDVLCEIPRPPKRALLASCQVHGDPTDADRQTLSAVMAELNDLIAPLQIRLATESPNVVVHFVPEARFVEILPEFRPPNRGFHWVRWNEFGEIYAATVLIPRTGVSQAERSHILREELTQSLGFLMDSNRHPDSIFYSGWTTVTEYSDLDRAVIRLLYDPQVEPGSLPDFADQQSAAN